MTTILTARWTDAASGRARRLTLLRSGVDGQIRLLVVAQGGATLVDTTVSAAIFAEFEPGIREGLTALGAAVEEDQ